MTILIIIGGILSFIGFATLGLIASAHLIDKYDDHSRDYKLRK